MLQEQSWKFNIIARAPIHKVPCGKSVLGVGVSIETRASKDALQLVTPYAIIINSNFALYKKNRSNQTKNFSTKPVFPSCLTQEPHGVSGTPYHLQMSRTTGRRANLSY